MSFRDWLVGTVVSVAEQSPTARSFVLDVPGWNGSTAGQHVDIRLTADDGYQAVRAYSLASTGPGSSVELAVDLIEEGEVSPYLVLDVQVGDQLELRGPLGRWFVWKPEFTAPLQLIAGGSGIVPLLAMVRAHRDAGSTVPLKLLYSVRSHVDVYFADELRDVATRPEVDITFAYTRRAPAGWSGPVGRITRELVADTTFPPRDSPAVFICGPNGFVATASELLVGLGHDPLTIKTERFGGA